MATKKKSSTASTDQTWTLPDDLGEKLEAYAAEFQMEPGDVVTLALRDWFSDIDRGRRPRSSSILEPANA